MCYQGPSVCLEGLTVVVSPLRALTEDQVRKFNRADYQVEGIRMKAIYPGMNGMSLYYTRLL